MLQERPVEIDQNWQSRLRSLIPIFSVRETIYSRKRRLKRSEWLDMIAKGWHEPNEDVAKWMVENGYENYLPQNQQNYDTKRF